MVHKCAQGQKLIWMRILNNFQFSEQKIITKCLRMGIFSQDIKPYYTLFLSFEHADRTHHVVSRANQTVFNTAQTDLDFDLCP